MRKTIFAIGMYVICLSVFSFCTIPSDANYDQRVTNAIERLRSAEGKVRDRKEDVDAAWGL